MTNSNGLVKIATWNVNSIRARLNLVYEWIKQENPDILLLQETKCLDHHFPNFEFESLGYNYLCKGQMSYNGVAIISKHPLTMEVDHLPVLAAGDELDNECRYLEASFSINGTFVRVASVYVPNGGSKLEKGERLEDSKRFIYKLRFFERLYQHLKGRLAFDEIFLIGGDYNVAHNEIDLYNPKTAAGEVGFHQSERQAFNDILSIGYTDIFRHMYPDSNEYSWWDYRRDGWNKNRGWRIDYLLTTPLATKAADSCIIDKAQRALQTPSDHVPVVVNIKLP